MRIRCFTFFRIHKYNILFGIILLSSLYCDMHFSNFFVWFKEHVICLILSNKFSDVLPAFLVQELFVIFEVFVQELIFSDLFYKNIFSFRYSSRIIIKKFDNFFSRFIECFNIVYCYLNLAFLSSFY